MHSYTLILLLLAVCIYAVGCIYSPSQCLFLTFNHCNTYMARPWLGRPVADFSSAKNWGSESEFSLVDWLYAAIRVTKPGSTWSLNYNEPRNAWMAHTNQSPGDSWPNHAQIMRNPGCSENIGKPLCLLAHGLCWLPKSVASIINFHVCTLNQHVSF